MFDVGTAIGYLDLDTSGFKTGFKSALDDLESFSSSTSSVSEKFTSLGSAFQSVGSTLTKNVTIPLVGIGTAAFAVGNKFESAMSRVGAISGAVGDDLEALTDQAMDLGAATSFSATEAASGMENLASAGFTVKEIMAAMPGLLDLAASSGASLADASEIAASAIRGFGLDANAATHVADVFAAAAARTNAQTEDMGEAMKYIAPVAKAMGQSLEETAAAIGIMSDAGIKGSQAGTSLRGALSRLAKPTKAMKETIADLGLSFYDASGNMIPLNGIVQQLETHMKDLTQEQRNQALVTLFGQESLSGMLALMERGSDDLISLTEEFKSADGAASDMAHTMLDNTSGALEELGGSVETLLISLQQVLAPMLVDVVNWLTSLVNKFNDLDEETKKTVVTFLGIAAAAGPVLLIIGKLLKTIGSLPAAIAGAKTAFGVLSSVVGAISGPVLAVVAAVALVVAAFADLWKNNEEFRNNMTSIWEDIVTMIQTFCQGVTDSINSLGFEFEDLTEVLTSIWKGFCELLAPYFVGAFQILADQLDVSLDVVLGILKVFIAVLKGDWQSAWESFKDIFVSIWDFLVAWFNHGTTMWKNIANVFLGWFGTNWETVWENIKSFFKDTWNFIVSFFQNAIAKVVQFVKELPETVAYWLGYALGKVVSWVKDFDVNIQSFLSAAVRYIEKWGRNIIPKVGEIAREFLSAAVTHLKELPGKFEIWITKVLTWLNGIPAKMRKIGSDMLTSLWDGLKSVWTNVSSWLNGIGEKLSNIWGSFTSGFSAGYQGSYASGLDYVPRDMLVKVHQGESIRTKQQTKEDVGVNNRPQQPRQPLNVTLTVDGRVLGQVAISNINDISDTNGVVPLKI